MADSTSTSVLARWTAVFPPPVSPMTTPFRSNPTENVAIYNFENQEIAELIAAWKTEDKRGMDIFEITTLPSYQSIIDKGMAAVPLILKSLQRNPDHWFHALATITSADPVREKNLGNLYGMTRDWLEWGVQEGHIQRV